MGNHARWKIGLYPTEKDIEKHLRQGVMFGLLEGDVMMGAMAVAMNQEDDYHSINWSLPLGDDEVAVIHVLAVHPAYQGKGYGERL